LGDERSFQDELMGSTNKMEKRSQESFAKKNKFPECWVFDRLLGPCLLVPFEGSSREGITQERLTLQSKNFLDLLKPSPREIPRTPFLGKKN